MLYGGSAPKGQNTDPRAGKVRQDQMRASRGGGGDRRGWLIGILIVLVVVLAVVVVALLATGEGDDSGTETTVPGARTSVGQLDCTPGAVAEQVVPTEGRNPREFLQAMHPGVVSVAQDPMDSAWVWGYDTNERVIAGLIESDVDGEYTVYVCE